MSSQKPLPTVVRLSLPGVMLLETKRWPDERGWFTESWQADDFTTIGINDRFIQDNLVMNEKTGILRGLHWQAAPYGQAKLIRCLTGEILDVVADVNPKSPTYGQWVAVSLKAEEGKTLYIPESYAHGYVTKSEKTLVLYKVNKGREPNAERGIRWDDPTLGIDWGIKDPILSEKDQRASYLK